MTKRSFARLFSIRWILALCRYQKNFLKTNPKNNNNKHLQKKLESGKYTSLDEFSKDGEIFSFLLLSWFFSEMHDWRFSLVSFLFVVVCVVLYVVMCMCVFGFIRHKSRLFSSFTPNTT